MDTQHEIERLNGELFALRALLFYFLDAASVQSPAIVRAAFDNAADHVESATVAFGKSASPLHLAKALEIVEDLRSKIFPR
jgi:hypothetical protein